MRRRVLIALGCVLLLSTAFLICTRQPGPNYRGRALGEWLILYDSESRGAGNANDAANAIRHIGSNAFPYMLEWIRYEAPQWRRPVNSIASKLPAPVSLALRDKSFMRAHAAATAFRIFGSEALPAIPRLVQTMNDESADWPPQRALWSLVYIGQAGLPKVIEIASGSNAPVGYRLIQYILMLHQSAVDVSTAVPLLLHCAESTNAAVSGMATSTLGEMLHDSPRAFVPALTNAMVSPSLTIRLSAVKISGMLGEAFSPIAPAVHRCLHDPAPEVRAAASNALHEAALESQP